jgi:hypothetical protein
VRRRGPAANPTPRGLRNFRYELVASFRKERSLPNVGLTSGDSPQLAVVESVTCLGCGAVYAKPLGGGTVRENPGCPDCGYVGWMPTTRAVLKDDWLPRRSVAGPQPHRAG